MILSLIILTFVRMSNSNSYDRLQRFFSRWVPLPPSVLALHSRFACLATLRGMFRVKPHLRVKTYTGIKGDSCMRRNDAVAGVMPADAGISTNK